MSLELRCFVQGSPLVADPDPNTTPPRDERIFETPFRFGTSTGGPVQVIGMLVDGTSCSFAVWVHSAELGAWFRVGSPTGVQAKRTVTVADVPSGARCFVQLTDVVGGPTMFGVAIGFGDTTSIAPAGFTPEGGLYTTLINKTGAPSVKGNVVSASAAAASAFILQTNEYDSIGVVYDAGVADGLPCRVVISGIADVLLKDTTGSTMGQWLGAADTDGRAQAAAIPVPLNADSHFKEIGHVLQTVVAGVSKLCRAVIHFN